MTDKPNEHGPASGPVPRGGAYPWSGYAIALAAAVAAGATGHLIAGPAGWGAALAVSVVGAAVVTAASGSSATGEARARKLLEALGDSQAGIDRELEKDSGVWGTLYRRLNELREDRGIAGASISEVERVRRHADLAAAALREGRDPLTESAELRVGPLRDLLAAIQEQGRGPIVSRLPLGEEELIGTGGEALPMEWPARGAGPEPPGSAGADALAGIEELIQGLTRLLGAMSDRVVPGAAPGAPAGAPRTPAQLVDAVVHTAADGIEDLAAGLMRANELASVAERVTNRATLLALNAALEATRSGSEAFAAIAEETRRLAEFAREATDTISRLAGEIEYKVGETITAIHSTSEDAKSAVAALSPGGVVAPAPLVHRAEVEWLLRRARAIRDAMKFLPSERSDAGAGSGVVAGVGASIEPDVEGAAPAPFVEPAPASFADPTPAPLVEPPAPGLELSPRFETGWSEAANHDLAPEHDLSTGADPASEENPLSNPAAAAGSDTPTEYLHLLDRLRPGPGTT
jgi:hypothetical protein